MSLFDKRGKEQGTGGKKIGLSDSHPNRKSWLTWGLLLLILLYAYGSRMARSTVFGDPTEYTFVAHEFGIAHPPGYALMTLLGKLYQTVVPFGSIATRTHLIGVTAAIVAAFCIFAILNRKDGVAALFAALTAGLGVNVWQHAIHANPHMVTAAFLFVNLTTLTLWFYAERAERHPNNSWLYAFCVSAGLGVTHHPLTVFALPACVLFVLLIRPKILIQFKTLAIGTLFVGMGLLPWLYFPLRASALAATRYPSDMNTLEGFLNLVLARGLRVNLFAFGLADQFDRFTVFFSLLRLQYTWPIILLAIFGVGWLFVGRKGSLRPLLLLYGGAFVLNYIFVMNTVQDVMAYLLGPFLLVGLFAGFGMVGLFDRLRLPTGTAPSTQTWLLGAGLLLTLTGPIWAVWTNYRAVDLSEFTAGADYVDGVFARFERRGEGAVLLNDWEHMTQLWYAQTVDGRWPDSADLRPEFVSSARTWTDYVFDFLPGGPVYLNRFQREVFDAGFRLRTDGDLIQVVEPGDATLPSHLTPVSGSGGEIEIVGYALPEQSVTAGDFVPFTLAMRLVGEPTQSAYAPVLTVGEMRFGFTTDSHLLTTDWLPGEIIVESFDFALPHNLAAGDYPLSLTIDNLSQSQSTPLDLELPSLSVAAERRIPNTDHLLANWRHRVGLVSARARYGGQTYTGPWQDPIRAQSGDTIDLTLEWQALDLPEDSYTVFVHLIDLGNRPIVDHLDYTPLGGATPTHLWFPKWLPGQQMLDPYNVRLSTRTVVDGLEQWIDVPPGDYLLEVGLYEQFTLRRLHRHDADGNIIGDRLILGAVTVEP